MRTKVTHIGFQAEVKGGAAEAAPAKDAPKGVAGTPPVLVEDLIAYGFLPEFVGRFPVTTQLHELTEAQMVEVMSRPRNALLKQYSALFAADQVQLHVTQGALHAIARRARQSATGARGLRSIVEAVLLDSMFELPGWRTAGVHHAVLTAATVEQGASLDLWPLAARRKVEADAAKSEVGGSTDEEAAVSAVGGL